MKTAKVGNKAPDFNLTDSDGNKIRLSDFRGKKVVLFFYPRDNTPGCTKEACEFRDTKRKFDRQQTVIIGISPDSEKSHQKFRDKFDLPFVLVSDPDRKAATSYDVYKEKSMYGKKVMGIERSTFVIDENGKLIHEMRKVKVNGHVDEVLAWVKAA